MSCGCTRMRASTVGCRVLDRCGDSLGHGITIIYTTNKDGESIDSLAVGPPSKRVVV